MKAIFCNIFFLIFVSNYFVIEIIKCVFCYTVTIFPLGYPPIIAFNKNGLLIEFVCEKDETQVGVTTINLKATNSTPLAISDFVFQAAVPKVK